jgi:Tol biopolymer transport system component
MEFFKKILRTPSALVVLLAAILALVGVIYKSSVDQKIAKLPIYATQTAEAKLTSIALSLTPATLTQTFLLLPTYTSSVTATEIPAPTQTSTLLEDHAIAFLSGKNGNREIYLVNLDDTSIVNLTDNTSDDNRFKWSPDGQKIAFLRFLPTGTGLYVMDSDGSDSTLLIEGNVIFSYDWSPNNSQIVYGTDKGIYIVDATSGDYALLVSNSLEASGVTHPISWSPDGSKIVFSGFTLMGGNLDVFLMNATGSELIQMTNDEAFDFNVAWASDGQKIAIMTTDSVSVMNGDGTNRRTVYESRDIFDLFDCVAWSLDSKTIIFDDKYDIMRTVNTDGSDLAELRVTGQCPSWSPDGQSIAFIVTETTTQKGYPAGELYIQSNSGITKITNGMSVESFAWQP